ncbi:armadillo-like helical domain-containing protein 3 [Lytechinus variegatus]|uniref:armadillo-like helical domain-containing protein 3 n=1 Tax=Lytechinus variegatus TaxID=7654 RepID=UPI001BB1AAB2|nr:armadillo-like helical domain-containing protein 3 [Lytechinus variegatus]
MQWCSRSNFVERIVSDDLIPSVDPRSSVFILSTFNMPHPNQQVLRQGSQSKIELKEKILHIYDTFFQGKDPTRDNANFWDEFFLLKANVSYIENELDKLTPAGLLNLKENINALFYHCVMALEESYPIRVVNALQTLCALIRGVYQKAMVDHGFDVINILIGFDSAEQVMQMLIERLNNVLTGDQSISLKNLALKVLLVISTVANNVSQNTLLEYLMMNSVFESIVQILANPVARGEHGYEALLLLTILVNYRKYESANAYIVKLSILDDELALNGLGHVISTILGDFNGRYKAKQDEEKGSGWLSSITSMVGNMFVSEESGTHRAYVRDPNNATLLALYEAVHLNRNFITVLSHNHSDHSGSAPTTPTSPQAPAVPSVVSNLQNPQTVGGVPSTGGSTNILVTFLSYCSIIMQDLKDDERFSNTKLCLLILSCIAEDQYANSFLHDANLTFRVPLHQAPMRHRKQSQDLPARPLACALLDLTVEFILSHMMRNLPQELYLKCLGVIHRVLCYQKKCRVRLQYSWISIWTALISLLKYILASESVLLPSNNIFELACKVVNLFNLFITYGDTFLPSANCYDQLYYELIRMHQVFDNIYHMARRHVTNNGQYKDSANKLANNIVNIRAIINHFTPKIDSWAASQTTALTEEQVLSIVKNNYDTLTLKLQDSLDQFERYAEKPKESAFFTQLVRSLVVNFRVNSGVGNLEQKSVLQEFSTIQ